MIYTGSISKQGVKGVGYEEVSPLIARFVKEKGKNQFFEIAKLNGIYEPFDSTDETADVIFVRGKNGNIYSYSEDDIFSSSGEKIDSPAEIYSGDYTIKDGANVVALERELYKPVDKNSLANGKKHICAHEKGACEVEQTLYAQTAFMTPNLEGKGAYVRANDGTYVEKSKLEIPSYKKVELPQDEFLDIRNGVCYIRTNRRVVLPNGNEISLPNENVSFVDGRWIYLERGQQPVECEFKADEKIVEKFLYNDKVVDGSMVSIAVNETGDTASYTVRMNNQNQTIGQINAELSSQIVLGSIPKIESFEFKGSSLNQTKQAGVSRDKRVQPIIYTFAKPKEDGLTRVEVNSERTRARFIYNDRVVDYIVSEEEKPELSTTLDGKPLTVKYVKNFNFEDLRENALNERKKKGNLSSSESQKAKREADKLGVKFNYEVFEKDQNLVASQIVIKDGKVSSFYIGDELVSDVVWDDDKIVSYKFRGYTIEIVGELCTVKQGDEIVAENVNLKKSRYSFLAIEYKLLDKIENVKWANDGTIASFKLGDYDFSNITWGEEATIEKCDIKIKGKSVKNVSTQDMYWGALLRQLQFRITAQLTEQKFMPLLRTALFAKHGGKARLNADVVAGKNENGIADATELTNLEQSLRMQKIFVDEPYATHFEDENGVIHKVGDVNTTYDAKAEFVNSRITKTLSNILGNDEISYKKGKITVKRGKPTQKLIDNTMYAASICASSFFGLPLAVPLMLTAGIVSVVDRVKRNSTKHLVKRLRYDDVLSAGQEDAEVDCKNRLNKLVKNASEAIARVKEEYSSAELPEKLARMQANFLAEYNSICSELEMLQTGQIESKYDLSKGGKITGENLLGFLFAQKQQEELKFGKAEHPDFASRMKNVESSMLENFFLQQAEGEQKETYESASKKEKARMLKDFEKGFDNETKKSFEHFERTERIKVLEKLGGAKGYKKAYEIRLANLEEFYLNSCSAEQRIDFQAMDKKGKKAVLADYKKDMESAFAKSKINWGDVEDRIEAFKKTDEYRLALSPEKQRKLLADYRESVIKKANGGAVSTIELTDRFTPNGESKAERAGKAVSVYREMCLGMFCPTAVENGNPLFERDGKTPKPFDYDLMDRLQDQDKADYAPKSVHSLGSTIVSNEDKKTEVKNSVIAENKRYNSVQQNVSAYISNMQNAKREMNRTIKQSKYIDMLRVWSAMEKESEKVDSNTTRLKDVLIENSEYSEGVIDKKYDVSEIDYNYDSYQEKKDELDARLQETQASYDEQMETELRERFIESHKKEFEEFCASTGGSVDDENCKKNFVKSEQFQVEYERGRWETDFRTPIQDEAIISLTSEMYNNFLAQISEKTNGNLPSEEIIKSMYVAGMKKEVPEQYEELINSDKYKSLMAQRLDEYFKQMAQQQTAEQENAQEVVQENPANADENAEQEIEQNTVQEDEVADEQIFGR